MEICSALLALCEGKLNFLLLTLRNWSSNIQVADELRRHDAHTNPEVSSKLLWQCMIKYYIWSLDSRIATKALSAHTSWFSCLHGFICRIRQRISIQNWLSKSPWSHCSLINYRIFSIWLKRVWCFSWMFLKSRKHAIHMLYSTWVTITCVGRNYLKTTVWFSAVEPNISSPSDAHIILGIYKITVTS